MCITRITSLNHAWWFYVSEQWVEQSPAKWLPMSVNPITVWLDENDIPQAMFHSREWSNHFYVFWLYIEASYSNIDHDNNTLWLQDCSDERFVCSIIWCCYIYECSAVIVQGHWDIRSRKSTKLLYTIPNCRRIMSNSSGIAIIDRMLREQLTGKAAYEEHRHILWAQD